MVSVSKGVGRDPSLWNVAAAQTADIRTWQGPVSALVQHRTSQHRCARLDHMEKSQTPASYMSNSPAGCDNRRMPLEDQFLLSKTAAKLCWQNTSSCKARIPSPWENSTDTAASPEPLFSSPQNHHPSPPREHLRALHIIAIKKKKKQVWLNNFGLYLVSAQQPVQTTYTHKKICFNLITHLQPNEMETNI